jgi:hypothetical protein
VARILLCVISEREIEVTRTDREGDSLSLPPEEYRLGAPRQSLRVSTFFEVDAIGPAMASKRNPSNPKSRSVTSAPARDARLALLGPPPLLEGEDAALYDELVARMCAAVKPVDIIDEMFMADVISLEWEIMRWRRLKFSLLEASVHRELRDFLNEQLNYDDYEDAYAETLEKILQEDLQKNLAEDQAKELAQQCACWQRDAVEKVTVLLKPVGLDTIKILDRAKAHRAKELAEEYARRQPKAIKQVRKLLASSGRTMHDFMLEALPAKLDQTERIDRLIMVAETRRNASLREIDRHRAGLGEALRRNVQEVEGKFEVIEKGKTVA